MPAPKPGPRSENGVPCAPDRDPPSAMDGNTSFLPRRYWSHASFRRKSSPVRDVMEFRAVAMLKCGRAGSGQLVGLTAIASIEIRASGIGRATLGDDRAGFGSAENARV